MKILVTGGESVSISLNMLVKSSIDVCICGINVEIDGASPLISDMHGLNVTDRKSVV